MRVLLVHPATLDVWLTDARPGHWVRERVYQEDIAVFVAAGMPAPIETTAEHLAKYVVVVRPI